MPLVLRTEVRRLSAVGPSNSSRSTDERRDGSITPKRVPNIKVHEATELPGLQLGVSGNNAHEDASSGRSTINNVPESDTSKTRASVDKENVTLAYNRAKLYDVFMEKYGSMRAVFRAFDNDGNGMISAQRFHDMVEAAEVDFTPDETRALYRTADINGDNTVAFHEFVQMFRPSATTSDADAPAISAYSPVKDPLGPTRDPSSSVAIKYRTPLELSPRSRRRMKQLRKQVTDELRRKHGLAIGVRGENPSNSLRTRSKMWIRITTASCHIARLNTHWGAASYKWKTLYQRPRCARCCS